MKLIHWMFFSGGQTSSEINLITMTIHCHHLGYAPDPTVVLTHFGVGVMRYVILYCINSWTVPSYCHCVLKMMTKM